MITTHGTCLWARALAISLVLFVYFFPVICPAQPGTKLWEVTLGERVPFTPAIGKDGTIYLSCGTVGSASEYSRMLHAISPQGTTNWTFLAGAPIQSSPALGKDGTIYIATADGLYALNPAGATNWIFEYSGQRCSSPAVGGDGTIYLVTRTNASFTSYPSTLRAISPAGTVNWSCIAGGGVWVGASAQFSSPSIGPDGSIYVSSLSGYLYSISHSGSTNWTFRLGSVTYSSPSIGRDGTIYIGLDEGPLHAIHANGSLRRTYPVGLVESTPVLDQAGNIFIGSLSGFHCFNSDGVQMWFRNGLVSGSAAIAADGTVYIANYSYQKLYAYSSAGTNLWSFNLSGESFSSPVIGSNGTIYVVGGIKLYAIAGSAPPLNSSWPMFRRDAHNSARSLQRSIQTIKPLPDGNVELQLKGETGRAYKVEASTNLMVWETLASFDFTEPSIAFVDASSTNFASRYYRLSTSQ
ncbi:MAG: PQQ-binding-like beta-propeller repeat protein [Verrucomicrobiota bacterium]